MWSRVSGPTGAISEWTRGGLARHMPMDFKAQARVDSDLALWKEWADNDERKDLLPRPLLGTSDAGKRARPLSAARSASDQGSLKRDPSRMVDARGGEQGGGIRTPILSEVRAQQCWGQGSIDCGHAQLVVKRVSTFLRLTNNKERLRLATNSSGRLLDAPTMAQFTYGCITLSLTTVSEANCL